MSDMEKVIKGLEQFRADLKPFCGDRADWDRFDAGLSLLKEQEKRINELEEKLRLLEYGDQDILQSGMMPAT